MRLNSSSKHKQNLEGLLRMAVENSGHELEASNNSVVADAENMMFLQEALNSMTTDFAPAYTNAIKDLQSESTTVDKKKDSLNIIRENIDDIDLANGFVKVGGALLLIQLIKETTDSDLRSKSAYIIAEMSQNNDFCQKYFNNENIIPYLSSTINDNNENVSRSSIFAISSLIQNYEPGLNSFLEANGIEMLVLGLDSKHSTVYTKAAFLIGSLSSQKSTIKDLFNRVNAASSLIKNLEDKSEYDQKLYVTLFALSSLSSDCDWSSIWKNQAEKKSILNNIVNNKMLLESCEEIVTFATTVWTNTIKQNKVPAISKCA